MCQNNPGNQVLTDQGFMQLDYSSMNSPVSKQDWTLTQTGTGPDLPYIDLAVLGALTTLQQLQFFTPPRI